MEWVEISNCTQCPENLKCLRPQFYRLPVLCLHEDIKNLTEFLREGPPETVTTTTASAIISPTTPSPPAAFPLLFWTTIICLLLAILLLQIITMTKAARDHLAKRTIRKGLSHRHRRQRPHQGPGHGIELNCVGRPPFIQAFPEPLAVNSRPAAVGMCSELSFHQQLNRQWALAEHAAQPVQNEVVNVCVATKQLEDIQEEDEEFERKKNFSIKN
uniref:Uncharacterized protein n=1 Tax=Globodera rostochiensis TaxID=31243 RepID=A0A914HGI2_GLORO